MSKILQVENLVQEFNLTKDFLDKVKFKNGHFFTGKSGGPCGQQCQL